MACKHLRYLALWTSLLLGCWTPTWVIAQVVVVPVPQHSAAIPSLVAAFELPLTGALDPEAIWQTPLAVAQSANSQGRWNIGPGHRTVAKFTLSSQAEHIFTLEVPLVRLDLVEVFLRTPGQPWSRARAGDTVPLSQWPVVGQFATFMLHFVQTPSTIDVLMVMQNTGAGSTTVLVNSDHESRERRLLQATMAGLLIGASAMVLLVSLLLALTYRKLATSYFLLYCASVTLGVVILNGYGAVWFTPEWPQFNDSAKPFAASLIAASMLLACVAALDRKTVTPLARLGSRAVALLIVFYAVLQAAVLPYEWRLLGGVVGALVPALMVLVFASSSWRRGDRYAVWIVAAAVFYMASIVVVAQGYVQIASVDMYAVAMAVLLMASCLLLRYVLIARERFGIAVLGRAGTNRFNDPLTALLSYEGFERAVENLAVRQHTGGGAAHLLYFSLTELDNFRSENGYEVWQRDLVRFAAVLQKVLGESWSIARLSNSKFGAVRLGGAHHKTNEPLLTLVLSSCARKIDTEGWANRVGLRMSGTAIPLGGTGLQDSLRVLEQAVRDLKPGKRIALL